MKNVDKKEKDEIEVKFDKFDMTNLEELEEIVTPGWGTEHCCY